MNFFESQDRARKNTFQLVFLFALAVVALIFMTNLLFMVVFGYINSEQIHSSSIFFQQMNWKIFAIVSGGVIVVVAIGSLHKIMMLSDGGKTVAEALGGRLIPQNTDDLKLRKLLNIVEEIAIASGIPAPPVYLLAYEPGINAFAAGFTPRDAVIGVTHGCIDHLSRDQLQGVIAHEFSHIFNGDMRLNIHLMGVLNGIVIIGMAGYYLLRSTTFPRRRRSSNKGAGGMLVLAIGLMVIGFCGTFFGNLIKAAVSRQREFLADASAVQFTRNPSGIAGALKRIGGFEYGSEVRAPGANEVSHAFFAQGVSGFMQFLSATHPPLTKRILRIDPYWNGEFDFSDKTDLPRGEKNTDKKKFMTREELASRATTIAVGASMADIVKVIDQIGNPKPETIDYTCSLIAELSKVLKETAREPYGACAVIYSMVLDPKEKVQKIQLEHLQKYVDPDVFMLTNKLLSEMDGLNIKYRLPIIDIAIPALKQLSLDQYLVFRYNLATLIKINSSVRLQEWLLQKILFKHLDGQFFKLTHTITRYFYARQAKKEIELILSVMAYAGHKNQNEVEAAFAVATTNLECDHLQLVAKNEVSFSELDRSLQELEKLKPSIKQKLLTACAVSVTYDQKISPVEVELLRVFSDVLDCPMPPVIM